MIRLAIRVSSANAELVLAEILELIPDGVEEVELGGEIVEYAAYGAPGELPALPALRAAVGEQLVEISTSEVADDWHERWRRFHRPVLIDAPVALSGAPALPSLRVRPPWEPAASARTPLEEIVIDPGQAFGTGAHATTRLCLELLMALAASTQRRAALLDVGTGSGVLAIAAARLGFAPVLALDNDPQSVSAARHNARANAVQVQVSRLDLRSEALPDNFAAPASQHLFALYACAPVLCANLLRPLLLELAASLAWTPSTLIAGGLLSEEVDEVVNAFTSRLDLTERQRRHSGEWSAVLLAAA